MSNVGLLRTAPKLSTSKGQITHSTQRRARTLSHWTRGHTHSYTHTHTHPHSVQVTLRFHCRLDGRLQPFIWCRLFVRPGFGEGAGRLLVSGSPPWRNRGASLLLLDGGRPASAMPGPTDHHLKPPRAAPASGVGGGRDGTHGHYGWRTAGGTATRRPGSGTSPYLATSQALIFACVLHTAVAASRPWTPQGSSCPSSFAPSRPLLFLTAGLVGYLPTNLGPPAMCLSMHPYSQYTHTPCRLDVPQRPYACLPCR